MACVHRSGGVYDRFDYVGPLARRWRATSPRRIASSACRTGPTCRTASSTSRSCTAGPASGAKVELFRPGLFSGPVLYLDLDTIICGDITDIAAATDPLLITWDMQHGWINSSFVRWSVDLSFVYDALCADPPASCGTIESGGLWGDQGLLQDQLMRHGVGGGRKTLSRSASAGTSRARAPGGRAWDLRLCSGMATRSRTRSLPSSQRSTGVDPTHRAAVPARVMRAQQPWEIDMATTAHRGRDALMKVSIDGGSVFATVGGIRTNNFTINNEPVDITNADSAGFRELLADGGVLAEHRYVRRRRGCRCRRIQTMLTQTKDRTKLTYQINFGNGGRSPASSSSAACRSLARTTTRRRSASRCRATAGRRSRCRPDPRHPSPAFGR